jgi:hypothetical protein
VRPPRLEPRRHEVTTATVLALVDAARSQAVDLNGTPGAEISVLADRASLLASLVTRAPMTQQIAVQAGVPPALLVGVPEKRLGRRLDDGPQVLGAAVNADDPRAYVVRAKVPILDEGATPIIQILTQAPTRLAAARLANATVAALKARIEAVADTQGVPRGRSLTVTQLSSPRIATVERGLGMRLAAMAALVVFLLGCGAILLASSLRSAWRRAGDLQRPTAAGPT